MPELPEVEAARSAIETHCLGKKIKKAIIADDPKVIDGVSPSDFQASLIGKTIVGAHRKGKNMWLELDSPPFPSFQFGMAGAIYIKGVAVTKYKRSAVKDTDEWPSKYSKLFLELEDGLELSFTDKRRFARVRLLKEPKSVPPISELGPDALYELMPVDEFVESLSKKKIAIKALLLDQSYITGIGNWIADEVLYQSRIHPLQQASSLSKESCEALHQCIKEVIEKALEVGADSSQFPSSWIFHSREKKPGKAFVDGKKIDFITAGGRTSAYVPELQKLTGKNVGKAPSRSKKQSTDKDEDENGDDEEADEEVSEKETTKKARSKKGQNTGKGRAVKPPVKRKSKEGDSDDDGNDSEENSTTKLSKTQKTKDTMGKAPSRSKKKSTNKDDDENGDDEDEDEEELSEKETTKKARSKKGQNTGKGGAVKPPVKKKSKEGGDSDGDGNDSEEKGTSKSSKTQKTKVEASQKKLKNSNPSAQIKKKAKK